MTLPKIWATASAITFALSSVAFADDAFISDCEEFKSVNAIDGDCDCMAAAANEAGVRDEVMATETLDDVGGLSAEALKVIEACT